MVTTIKVQDDTKRTLDSLKRERETYDDLLRRLTEKERREALRARLIAGYQAVAEEQLEEFSAWDALEQ